MENKNGYVVDNARQKEYLYALGFDYVVKEDRKNVGKVIWVFNRTELLLDAIDFYIKTRDKTVKNK